MGKIIEYEHHGRMVKVDEDLKGKHRDHCLCYRDCLNFKPGTAENCPIAQAIYKNCVDHGVTTPVFECVKYEAKA